MLMKFFSFQPVPDEDADDEFQNEAVHFDQPFPLCFHWRGETCSFPSVFGKIRSPAGGAVSERVLKMLS